MVRPLQHALRLSAVTRPQAADQACGRSDELSECQPPKKRPPRIEYNLFAPPENVTGDKAPLITLEKADQEWLDSMDPEGWPVLPPSFFKRYHLDGEVFIPLRNTSSTRPS